MAHVGTVTIEVRAGPAYRASLDVLDLATELLALVPDWHEAEREELRQRALGLAEMIQSTLKAKQD